MWGKGRECPDQYSYILTWKNGRRLATAEIGSTELSFEYNDEGIRTSKIVNGVEHTYYLNGSQILAEAWGTELLVFIYDAEGTPIGMQYHDGSYQGEDEFTTFWYEKNLQGDIIAVYTNTGLRVLSYVYDAWGNCTTVNNYDSGVDSGSAPAYLNPFRYRGYYYDTETGFYYLQSRYYDPAIGRFINADGYVNANGDILGFNMYAYCGNNPVINSDPRGEWWHIAIGAIIGCFVAAVTTAITTAVTEGSINWGKVGVSAAVGAATGALCACGIPAGGIVAVTAAGGAIESVGHDLIDNYDDDPDNDHSVGDIVLGAFISGGTAALFASCGAASASQQGIKMNQAYKAAQNATNTLMNNGLYPAVKAAAVAAQGTYVKAVKKIAVSSVFPSLIESLASAFSTLYERLVYGSIFE